MNQDVFFIGLEDKEDVEESRKLWWFQGGPQKDIHWVDHAGRFVATLISLRSLYYMRPDTPGVEVLVLPKMIEALAYHAAKKTLIEVGWVLVGPRHEGDLLVLKRP